MRRIRSKDTKPELYVRRLLHRMGYRYRLHVKELAGKPDICFGKRRKVIFVHGCFWHQHKAQMCLDGRLPKSRQQYWLPKLSRNRQRDAEHLRALRSDGWSVLIIWECETGNLDRLAAKLSHFLH